MFRGDRLADIRKYEGISQKELAGVLGVEPNTIYSYEHGVSGLSVERMIAVSKYFNVSLDYFLGLIDEPIPIDRKDVVVLPKNFPKQQIPKVKEYIKLLVDANK